MLKAIRTVWKANRATSARWSMGMVSASAPPSVRSRTGEEAELGPASHAWPTTPRTKGNRVGGVYLPHRSAYPRKRLRGLENDPPVGTNGSGFVRGRERL